MYTQPSLSAFLLLPNFLLPERKNQSSESVSSSHFLSALSVCRLCIKAHGFFCIYAHLTRTSAHRSASRRRAFMSFILLKPLLLFHLFVCASVVMNGGVRLTPRVPCSFSHRAAASCDRDCVELNSLGIR